MIFRFGSPVGDGTSTSRSNAPDSALASLDRIVDQLLEKRRWLAERKRGGHAAKSEAGATLTAKAGNP